MVFLSYFLYHKHFGNLGTFTVNSRYQQTVLKLQTMYLEDQRESLGLCLQPVGVTLMTCFFVTFHSLDNQIGLFCCVVMERFAVPPRCMQIVTWPVCVSAYWERYWKYCEKSAFDQKIIFLCLSQWNRPWSWIFSTSEDPLTAGNFVKEICDSNKVVIQTLLYESLQNSALQIQKQSSTWSIYLQSIILHMKC